MIEALLRGRLASLLEHLLDVTDLDNAEGRDGRERVAFPAIQLVGPLPLAHDLALGPAGQVHMPREHSTFVVSRARPFATAALADRATICALHLGIAEGLTDGTDAIVSELVAYDPRKADCRLRIRVAADDESAASGTLSLRGRTGSR